ncbi:acylphosphatase [Ignisphaera sp. 4213-co]|uniref:Acylphosphatase n=1 Tax=Ignisphaera cupida TaxID=3050454 RepID=A0ABD4Z7Y5_9CREN|nr:acylphosphatase [Ignisphaera sp. 4213-co]MDK6029456.1 acylphosphatase [Ignisphaera sp. 4213-co]
MAKAVMMHVYGDVQGVGFRARIKSIALAFGVFGYVRNLPDGSVEIHVEGDDDRVNAFVETIKSLREFDIWEVKIKETSIKNYNEFFIIP